VDLALFTAGAGAGGVDGAAAVTDRTVAVLPSKRRLPDVSLSDALARRRVRVALPVLWAAAVLVASVVDPPSTGPTPALGGVGLDKMLHAGAYGVLAVLLVASRRARSRGELSVLTLASAGFGAFVEVVQLSFPARTFSGADALANLVGAAVAVALWLMVRRRLTVLGGE